MCDEHKAFDTLYFRMHGISLALCANGYTVHVDINSCSFRLLKVLNVFL